MTTHISGISAYYDDSEAALVAEGIISAATQEERFARKNKMQALQADAVERNAVFFKTTLKRELGHPGESKISDLSQLTFTQPRVALGNRELSMETLAGLKQFLVGFRQFTQGIYADPAINSHKLENL